MTAAKRALIKLALVGTLAGGALGMPLVASAAAQPNQNTRNCHGASVSDFATSFGGVRNAARAYGFSVKDGQQEVRYVCSGGEMDLT